MGKSIGYVFLGLSLFFFLFIIGWTGYRIDSSRKANSAAAGAESIKLHDELKALKDSSGGFDSPFFRDKAHEIFIGQPRLLALAIYSQSAGISYLITRNKSYVEAPADLTPDWRGTPGYKASRGFEELFTLPFPSTDQANMDALFVVFGKEDLFPILRDDLYVLLAFLIVCGIFILFAYGLQGEEKGNSHALTPVPIVQGHLAGQPVPPAPSPPAGQPPEQPEAPIVPPAPMIPPAPQASPTGMALKPEGMVSPVSGLVWGACYESKLKFEIERAASSDEDLAVARVEIDIPIVNPTVYNAAARLLLDTFPLHDLIFEGGVRGFNVILPNMDIDQAVNALENLRARAGQTLQSTLSIGVSARGGRLVESATLSEEADLSASKAMREGGNRVCGFRADPSKYRGTLSGLGA
jgi:hypothetical protein